MIYLNGAAKELLATNLEHHCGPEVKGYFMENGKWVAFDNSTGDCFVEEFAKEEQAIAWVENYFDMSEFEEFKITKIFRGVYYMPGQGILRTTFNRDRLCTRLYRLKISINFSYSIFGGNATTD